jgi:hypothetical protein
MGQIGYAFLKQRLGLSAFGPERAATFAPVTRITATPDAVLVPANVAPGTDEPLEHLLFALKHEGVDLQLLAQSLRAIPATALREAICEAPSGKFTRIAGYLWELFNRQELEGLPAIAGPTVDLFDPHSYVTGPGQRNAKWRVNFNGLGTPRYCVTVRRTETIETLLAHDILAKAKEFLNELGPAATDRALAWAYLHETESSFAIEDETPTASKAEAFVSLLRQAHQPRLLDEAYLVELQNAVITNPLDKAVAYRTQQNWLRGPLRGAAGITYLPPPPEWAPELMEEVLAFANNGPRQIDPLVSAAVASFAFVFIHPFMDGNGRLSRFLFHYVLCQSGAMSEGVLLPVSVAMKRNEYAYLKALQSVSVPMRKRWDVRWIGDDNYDFNYLADDTLYRYWDATPCVEFALEMARQSLENDLREETAFLARYDVIFKAVDERFDVRGSDLATLVISCMQNNGKLSKNRRKQYSATVPQAVFEAIEEAWLESQSVNE